MTTVPTPAPATPTDPRAGAGSSQTLDALIAGCNASCPRCHAPITTAQLTTMFPAAPADRVEVVKNAFNEAFEKFEIIRCLRKAHLFAQILGEVGTGLAPHAERLNYSAARIQVVFPGIVGRHPDILSFTSPRSNPPNEEAIANRVYSSRNGVARNGNGDVASGDGWRYRGRGYLQLTWKNNYAAVQAEIDRRYPGSGVDIINNEADISTPRGAMISAMGFWTWKRLSPQADLGDADSTVNRITRLVNGNAREAVLAERRTAYGTTKVVFRTAECVDRDKPSSAAQPRFQSDALPSASIG